MADDLKRVGLVFKADGTTDFTKSLKEVNASIQENRSAFKLAKSTWDESTKSAEKLKETQKYLSQQTKDYSDKVKLLEEELEQLESAEKRDEAAIQKKKNQLNTAKTSLNNYRKGLEEVNLKLGSMSEKLKNAGESVKKFGNKMSDAGKTVATHVTAPIMAIGTAAVGAAMKLDDGYDTIIKKTGATGETLQELNDVADEVFGSMPVEMTDVGTAVGEVNTRFHTTGDELGDLSKEFLKFAEINETDLNSSIDNTDAILKKYNLDASEAKNVLGLMTKAGQDTGISMETLQGSLMKNGTTLKEMGLDLTASVELLAQFEANGVDSTAALAGLKKAQQNATKEGKTLKDALGETITSIKNAGTETEALQIATELFGTKGAAEMTQAIREGKISVDDLSTSLGDYANVVSTTFEETLDPWDKAKVAANDLMLAGADLGKTLMETLAPILEEAAGKVKEFSEWFRNLDENQKKTIVTIAMVVAAIGPLLLIFGKVTTGIGGIVTGVGKISEAVTKYGPIIKGMLSSIGAGAKALWGIIAANPVIAIIAAIIAVVVLLYNKCEWFRDGVNAVISNVIEFFSNFGENIKELKETVSQKFEEIRSNITEKIQAARDKVSGASEKIKEFLDFGKLKDSVLGKFDDIRNGIKEKIEWARDKVDNAIEKIRGFFNFNWELPKIKLPHFSIVGDFGINPPRTPHFSVEWYKDGGILQSPTLFGMNAGKLLGGGEAGKEAVLPIDLLRRYMREENQENNMTLVKAFIEAFKELMDEIDIIPEVNLYLGDRKLADTFYDIIIRKINGKERNKRRAAGV